MGVAQKNQMMTGLDVAHQILADVMYTHLLYNLKFSYIHGYIFVELKKVLENLKSPDPIHH